jgi:hypothetical protein
MINGFLLVAASVMSHSSGLVAVFMAEDGILVDGYFF